MAVKLSIIIPVYNEGKTVAEVIGAVKAVDLKRFGIAKEIIVVDDGSTDSTAKAISGIGGIKALRHKANAGKGAAVRTGIANSKGEIIIIQDADLEYDPKQIPKVIGPIMRGEKVVYGSRRLGVRKGRSVLLHDFGNLLLSAATSALFGMKITDMETGYKAFRREVVGGMRLESKRFEIEPEITAKIIRRGYRIIEVPIDFSPRSFKEGKKITAVDGFRALWALLKYRFLARP